MTKEELIKKVEEEKNYAREAARLNTPFHEQIGYWTGAFDECSKILQWIKTLEEEASKVVKRITHSITMGNITTTKTTYIFVEGKEPTVGEEEEVQDLDDKVQTERYHVDVIKDSIPHTLLREEQTRLKTPMSSVIHGIIISWCLGQMDKKKPQDGDKVIYEIGIEGDSPLYAKLREEAKQYNGSVARVIHKILTTWGMEEEGKNK